jgi:hypothetical protein
MWIFPVIIIGLLIIILLGIAGPKKIPQEGVDYQKIVEEDGSIVYKLDGGATPQKPEPFSFLERFHQGMDRLA